MGSGSFFLYYKSNTAKASNDHIQYENGRNAIISGAIIRPIELFSRQGLVTYPVKLGTCVSVTVCWTSARHLHVTCTISLNRHDLISLLSLSLSSSSLEKKHLGHERIRDSVLDQCAASARGIVFVVDSGTISKQIRNRLNCQK